MKEDEKKMLAAAWGKTVGEINRDIETAKNRQPEPQTSDKSVVGICSACGKGITQIDLMRGVAGLNISGQLVHFAAS